MRAGLCGLVLLCACGSDGRDAVDDAAASAAFEVSATPRLSLGVVEGDSLQEFDRVVTPLLLADGRVLVPVSRAGSIRIFDERGAFLGSLGRAGNGPGEFRMLLFAWARGDTIEALDFRLRRITRFLPDGTTAEILIRTDLPDLSGAAGPLGDGWAVAGVAEAGLGRRDRVAVHRIARDGTDLGEIASVDGMARYATPQISGPEPLSPRALVVVAHDRIYIADTLAPVIRVVDAQGAPVRGITWDAARRAGGSAVLREVVDSAAAQVPVDRAVSVRERYADAPAPEQLSVLWKFVVDDRGYVWIRDYDPLVHAFALGAAVGPGGQWRVLSPESEPVSVVAMPGAIEPFQITDEAVIGIGRDSLGVESVHVHPLRRR